MHDAIAALPALDLCRFQCELKVDTLPLQLQGKKAAKLVLTVVGTLLFFHWLRRRRS